MIGAKTNVISISFGKTLILNKDYWQANPDSTQMKNLFILFIIFLSFTNCKDDHSQKSNPISNSKYVNKVDTVTKPKPQHTEAIIKKTDTVEISKEHKINTLKCDLDGDKLKDTIQIVRSIKSGKSGLKIIYGNNKKTDYLGLGSDVLNQGFDEIDWVGIFEVAPKNKIYYSNVNEEGEIISEEEVKESDKIRLKNDGIFIHAEESCGGGIIYLENGRYKWIQRE